MSPTVHTVHYPPLHYTTLHYTTLHYTTLHYTTLHYTTAAACWFRAVHGRRSAACLLVMVTSGFATINGRLQI